MPRLTYESLDEGRLLSSVRNPDCGAVIVFSGTARRFTGDHETTSLLFEAYEEMALRELERLERDARERFRLRACAIEHRLGEVPCGETTVVVALASPHREAAFEAVAWVMNELKQRVPIWKKDIAPNGETTWVPNQVASEKVGSHAG